MAGHQGVAGKGDRVVQERCQVEAVTLWKYETRYAGKADDSVRGFMHTYLGEL